ncbi:hypothetical protein LSAT2_012848 [Lamellibrachia satsuma]|nr:hypothetical protein LSAT2_012848 [Lamellibrachia satsuma]
MRTVKEEYLLAGRAFISLDVHQGITFAAKKGKHTATELQGVLLANMKIPTGLVWDYYTEEVAEMLRRNYDISLTAKDVQLATGLFHDAALLWAISLNKTRAQQLQAHATPDGFDVAKNYRDIHFEGVTGDVNINANGDRISDYTIFVVQFGKNVPMFDFIASKPESLVPRMNTSAWAGVLWPGEQLQAPSDSPLCGWSNEKCVLNTNDKKNPTLFSPVSGRILISMSLLTPLLPHISTLFHPLSQDLVNGAHDATKTFEQIGSILRDRQRQSVCMSDVEGIWAFSQKAVISSITWRDRSPCVFLLGDVPKKEEPGYLVI